MQPVLIVQGVFFHFLHYSVTAWNSFSFLLLFIFRMSSDCDFLLIPSVLCLSQCEPDSGTLYFLVECGYYDSPLVEL